ncbi:MAG: carboxymuconolactone decarboxylase family protein [Sphingomonadaceae bacterium]|jgi:4-carboxymuconolactone decarboxylase
MSDLLDPGARSKHGAIVQTDVTGQPAGEPQTLLQEARRDFVFSEVWSRPGLDRRARFLIAMAGAACTNGPAHLLDAYVRGALNSGELSLAELREAALHLSIYAGWSRGTEWDEAITRVQDELGLAPVALDPVRGEPWDAQERMELGAAEFTKVMTFGGPPPGVGIPYLQDGILNFVFGEMWCRRGLDERSRRWITLVGVAESTTTIPVQSHFYAAMKSGNCTPAEMQEFVLQYAVHAGWPKGSEVQAAVLAQIGNFEKGLNWDGKPLA